MNFKELKKIFIKTFGGKGEVQYLRSPGRVNLIGEHTDYNEGFVFPTAISKEIYSLFRKRNDEKVLIYSLDFNEKKEFRLNEDLVKENSWIDYTKGVIEELKKISNLKYGAEIIFFSTLPSSSGLSSSAAFELANAFIFSNINKTV